MKRLTALLSSLSFVLLGTIGGVLEKASADVLAEYVAKQDDSYAWKTHARYQQGDSEIVELHLYSQTWRDILWKHKLFLIKPNRIETPNQGLLILGGGRWRAEYETEEPLPSLPSGAGIFLNIAQSLGTVVAVLGHVPFQPLFGKTEDHIIAYTFDQYLTTGDPEWPLLLPMVKSAVRAMDATQEASATEWAMSLEAFTVLGGSKRGWTTWLTAAVDSRVNAFVPVVIDALNMAQHFPYQTQVWGTPSEKIRPYTELNLHEVLGSAEGQALREIVDPFAYRSMLEQPKLIVIGTNDEYFPVDSLNLYWDELSGPKYILYLPNDRHSTRDYGRLIPSLNALHKQAIGGAPLPRLAWEYQSSDSGLVLCIRSDPGPDEVRAWVAHSDSQDFRHAVWTPRPLTIGSAGTYILEFPVPESGYSAVFGEAVFGQGGAAYSLSTNLNVVGSQDNANLGRPAPGYGGSACQFVF